MFNNQDENSEDNSEFFSPESSRMPEPSRLGFKGALENFGRLTFQRFDYLPPVLPPEFLAKPTIWKRLEETDQNSIAPRLVPVDQPPTILDMLKYRQRLQEN